MLIAFLLRANDPVAEDDATGAQDLGLHHSHLPLTSAPPP